MDYSFIALLLEFGADMNVENDNWRNGVESAFFFACQVGAEGNDPSIDLVNFFLTWGETDQINQRNKVSFLFLHFIIAFCYCFHLQCKNVIRQTLTLICFRKY
jgi:hypothetical protein